MTTYFTSDQHFSHENIIQYCRRPFADIDEMDRVIIDNYRKKVTKKDICFFIGDLSLVGKDNPRYYKKLLDKLPGQKHLILGNHDNLNPFVYVNMGFTSVHTSLMLPDVKLSNKPVILVHDPSAATMDLNSIFLCGHIHDLFLRARNAINVGVDMWNFSPVSLAELAPIANEYVSGGAPKQGEDKQAEEKEELKFRELRAWQERSKSTDPFNRTHPLTCGKCGERESILEPIKMLDGKAALLCPACGWIQTTYPFFIQP